MPLFPLKDVVVQGGKQNTQTTFRVPSHYELEKRLGAGQYGCVAAFQDDRTGERFAVKKITHAFTDEVDGKRILREVKLLRQLEHPNVLRILDILPPESPHFEDIYIVTDLMETDLQRIIVSKQRLTEEHHQYLMYQLLRGLVHLHSAHIVHRDLKPANLLVNGKCELKICDFGLARVLTSEEEEITDYVVTRWYRAPELVLAPSDYTESIDIWATGCIHCELITRKPLFIGKNYSDQVRKIVSVLGTPREEELSWLPKGGPGRVFLERFPNKPRTMWELILPGASEVAVSAVDAMVRFDPKARLSAADVLRLPFFEGRFEEEDIEEDTRMGGPADWSFDDFEPTKPLLQELIYQECVSFHPEILTRDKHLREKDVAKAIVRNYGLAGAFSDCPVSPSTLNRIVRN